MKLLLDTSTLIWWVLDAADLTRRARDLILDPGNEKFVSPVSAMEIATKARIGKLPQGALVADAFEAILADQGFQELPLRSRHAVKAGLMTGAHKDPFDRMLAAQSLLDGMVLISSDAVLDQFGVHRLW